jgi:hypothetical protein
MLLYARDPFGFLARCAREYGEVVRLTGPGGPSMLHQRHRAAKKDEHNAQ